MLDIGVQFRLIISTWSSKLLKLFDFTISQSMIDPFFCLKLELRVSGLAILTTMNGLGVLGAYTMTFVGRAKRRCLLFQFHSLYTRQPIPNQKQAVRKRF